MITNQTIDKLNRMKLYGMLEVIREQINKPGVFSELSFEERLGLIIDAEWMRRENNRMKRRLLEAKLRQEAVVLHDFTPITTRTITPATTSF